MQEIFKASTESAQNTAANSNRTDGKARASTPQRRRPRGHRRFSRKVLRAFAEMLRMAERCSCVPPDWDGKYWECSPQCAACDAWWTCYVAVHRALKLMPWQWPGVQRAEAPWPASQHNPNIVWEPVPERVKLYEQLCAALAAQEPSSMRDRRRLAQEDPQP